MKLSAALTKLKNLKSRAAQTNKYVNSSITYYSDEEPDNIYLEELHNHHLLSLEIRELKVQIQLTNATTKVNYSGKDVTLCELILLNADLRAELAFFNDLHGNGDHVLRGFMSRRTKEEVSQVTANGYDKKEIRKTIRKFEDEREELEGILASVNSNTEIVSV